MINPAQPSVLVVDGPVYIVQYYLPNSRAMARFPTSGPVTAVILANDPRDPAGLQERLAKEARALGMVDVRLDDIDVWLHPSALVGKSP